MARHPSVLQTSTGVEFPGSEMTVLILSGTGVTSTLISVICPLDKCMTEIIWINMKVKRIPVIIAVCDFEGSNDLQVRTEIRKGKWWIQMMDFEICTVVVLYMCVDLEHVCWWEWESVEIIKTADLRMHNITWNKNARMIEQHIHGHHKIKAWIWCRELNCLYVHSVSPAVTFCPIFCAKSYRDSSHD